MKRSPAFLLLIFVSLNSLFGTETAKFSHLFRHFQDHQKDNSEISFTEFMYMHYVGDDGNPLDNSEEENLPYKSDLSNCPLLSQNSFPASSNELREGQAHYYILYRTLFPQQFLYGIWQPPK